MDPVTVQLRQVTGVAPSTDWLNECYAALQNPAEGRSQYITFDMVLEQILYNDLRDVVRNFSTDENHSSSEADMSPNAILLRKIIDESKQNDCRKKDLPSSFRLLLQVEEICDVSKNAEARLTNDNRGTAGSCRKFCCVDGHMPPSPLLAIEVSPIVKTGGVLLPPGTKVLLTGPMTVRHGIMGWHAGNVLVLGGQVERLVQLQEQELQKRIQSSGHGIDPTIRALIWKQNDEHLRNEEDEDELASSDVVEMPPRSHDSSSSAPLPRTQANIVPNIPLVQPSPHPEPQTYRPAVTLQPAAPASTSIQNRYATQSRTTTARDVVPPSLTPPAESRPPPVRAPASVPAALSNTTSTVRNRYVAPSQMRTASLASVSSSSSTVPVPPVTTDDTSVIRNSTAVMTLPQMRSFLNRILQDETEYRQHCNRSFLVGPIQQVGPKLYFNIAKRRKDGNANAATNDKHYEYVENAKFGHESENDGGLITCRISNAILEPCFSLSATEMKKLTRSDKPKSDTLVRDGGKMVNQCLYQSGVYEATLEQSPERVFHPTESKLSLDGDTPILCLQLSKR